MDENVILCIPALCQALNQLSPVQKAAYRLVSKNTIWTFISS